jgi:hypothetical protein
MGDAVIHRPRKRLAPHLRVVENDFLKPTAQNDGARKPDATEDEILQRARFVKAGGTLVGARMAAMRRQGGDWE